MKELVFFTTLLRWRVCALTFAAAAVVSLSVSWSQPERAVIFDSEEIAVYIDGEYFTVEGLYTFRNLSGAPQRQQLFYPFPVDSLHPFPEKITVRSEGTSVPFRRTEDGVVFPVDVPSEITATIEVVYKQRCLDNTGCYILTTTSAWERPLSSASFEIVVAADIELESVSYEAGVPVDTGGVRRYTFGYKNFLPEKDLCLRWASGANH